MLRVAEQIGSPGRRALAFPRTRSSAWRVAISGSLLLLAAPAMAHDGTGLAGGFAAGFFHPLSGLDHMLAMVSVGLWGAFLGRPLL